MEEFIININLLLHERVDIDEKMNVTTARNSAKAGSVSKSNYTVFIKFKIETIFQMQVLLNFFNILHVVTVELIQTL